jgi:hypothetical protein
MRWHRHDLTLRYARGQRPGLSLQCLVDQYRQSPQRKRRRPLLGRQRHRGTQRAAGERTAPTWRTGGNVGIGTSTSQDALAVNGSEYLPDISVPGLATNRLYANGGDLYRAGNLIAGAPTGNWTSNGTNVWRTGGNIGVGTTSPFAALSIVGTGYLTGALTASGITAATSAFTNATSTNLAVSGLPLPQLSSPPVPSPSNHSPASCTLRYQVRFLRKHFFDSTTTSAARMLPSSVDDGSRIHAYPH